MMNDLLINLSSAGTAAILAAGIVHPIDLVKTRVQVSTKTKTNFKTMYSIASKDGFFSLWKGVQAAWLREATYTSSRLGLYEPVKKMYGCTTEDNTTFLKKFMAGSTTGAIGSVAGNPFDVLKTRLVTANNNIGMFELGKNMYNVQGIAGFYRGIDSNIARAMVLNGTKMACYEQIKDVITSFGVWDKNSIVTQFFAAMGAGFFMTVTVAPFDMVRTRLMNQPTDKKLYNNALDCAVRIYKKEGVPVFWKGFMPIWSRFAPNTTLQLIFYENIKLRFQK